MVMMFVVLALVVSLLPLGAVADDEHSNRDKEKSGTDPGQPEEITQKLLEKAAGKGLFGKWNETDEGMMGKFISLNISADHGSLTDLRLMSNEGLVPLIQEMRIDDLDWVSMKTTGSILRAGDGPIEATIHDNPTGLVHIYLNETATVVHILFATGIDVIRLTDPDNVDAETPNAVYLQGGSTRGMVMSQNGTYSIEEDDGGNWINATIGRDDELMIRFQPMIGERNGQTEEMILEAIFNDQIAGEVTLTRSDEGMVYEEMEYDPELFLDVLGTGPHRVAVSVTSESHEGKVIVITADSDSLGDRTRLQVKLDGKALEELDALDDVLHAQSTAWNEGSYAISQTDGLMQMFVYVPTFSTHEIELSVMDQADQDMPLFLALAGALAVVGLAGYLAFRRI